MRSKPENSSTHTSTAILWLSASACHGNAHSLLNYPYIESFLKEFEFVYHPILPSRYTLVEVASLKAECDILIIDGMLADDLHISDRPFGDLLEYYGEISKWILTVGTCATFGGIFSRYEEREGKGLHFDSGTPTDTYRHLFDRSISIPGCPVHPETLVSVLRSLVLGYSLPLDKYRRPLYHYAYTVHNGCTRNEYFEYKIDEYRFGESEGCSFYEKGCRGTFTRGSCNRVLWGGVNSKTRAGQPCMGCTEPDFPDMNLWETKKNMGIPARMPLGIPRRAYLGFAGIAKTFRIERFYKRLFDEED